MKEMALAKQTRPPKRESYHHGDLANVLIDEAAKLLAEEGATGFSMREVARRAGVAAAAPSHHFGNAGGLFTAVGVRGFERLVSELENVNTTVSNPYDRVVAMCEIYVDLTESNPGFATVMFRRDLMDTNNERYREIAPRAFALLEGAVGGSRRQFS